jgi:ATP-binding protein involved in chromosome partitioning
MGKGCLPSGRSNDPDGPVATIYKEIARRIAVKVAEKAKDMSSKFPSILTKND